MKQSVKSKTEYGRFLHAAICIVLTLVLACSGLSPAYAAEGYDKVAPSSQTAKSVQVGKYGMVPVYGFDVKDGTYEVSVDSSSTFFHIRGAELTVKDGKMSAEMTLSSTSYKFIYPGTAEEAAKAPLEDYVKPKDFEGESTFHVEVDALNKEIDCAAFSKKKKQWYNRKILFDAGTLPTTALKIDLPDYRRIEEALKLYDESNGTDTAADTKAEKEAAQAMEEIDEGTVVVEPVPIDMKDGTYSIQVALIGGSGRASVTTPTWLIVKDGKAYAKLLWSSTYYDYMVVGGKKYLNETKDGGNSTFTIPIAKMDAPMPVIADTTAMGDPLEIEYALTFYEASISDKNKVPQEAAIHVLIIALIIILSGAVLNFLVKRKRKQ